MMQASSSASQRIKRLLGEGVALADQIRGFNFGDGQERPVLGIIATFPIDHLREDSYEALRATAACPDRDVEVRLINQVGFPAKLTVRGVGVLWGGRPAIFATESFRDLFVAHLSVSLCRT